MENKGNNIRESSSENTHVGAVGAELPDFDPEVAKRRRGEAFFDIDPAKYEIFSRQGGLNSRGVSGTLSIHQTLGRMVGSTAETIAAITGELGENQHPSDHVIYLDKSARPVSWLVNTFWKDMTDQEKPEESFLAIDRRIWFNLAGVNLLPNEYIEEPSGARRIATADDFKIDEISREDIARIRSLYIPGGIKNENVEEIMATPTVLDGKHIMIVDEVSRSGSTISIAKKIIEAAIPSAKVHTHVFWKPGFKILDNGEHQMGPAPVWYPEDHTDWRGRGVKDVDPAFYERKFKEDPTPENRARKFGAFVLGVPLDNKDDEPGQLSWKLRGEILEMHKDYLAGHIVPDAAYASRKMRKYLKDECGVKFVPVDDKKMGNDPHTYVNLIEKRGE